MKKRNIFKAQQTDTARVAATPRSKFSAHFRVEQQLPTSLHCDLHIVECLTCCILLDLVRLPRSSARAVKKKLLACGWRGYEL